MKLISIGGQGAWREVISIPCCEFIWPDVVLGFEAGGGGKVPLKPSTTLLLCRVHELSKPSITMSSWLPSVMPKPSSTPLFCRPPRLSKHSNTLSRCRPLVFSENTVAAASLCGLLELITLPLLSFQSRFRVARFPRPSPPASASFCR